MRVVNDCGSLLKFTETREAMMFTTVGLSGCDRNSYVELFDSINAVLSYYFISMLNRALKN